MTKQEKVKAIFIEEAGEIIEKLDINIIRFEEESNDFELLNEIFRGVHTLKGNANAFGFTRLGEFVHHFEDLLDYYRSTKEPIEEKNLELFVDGVDMIQDIMECELNNIAELPASFEDGLSQIKRLLSLKKGGEKPLEETQEQSEGLNDLALEFTQELEQSALSDSIERAQKLQKGEHNLYQIALTLDDDAYKRGFDHIIFLKNLQEKALFVESFFKLEKVAKFESFKSDENYISEVAIVVLTVESQNDIEEQFDFLFDDEYSVRPLEHIVHKSEPAIVQESKPKLNKSEQLPTQVAKATVAKPTEIKHHTPMTSKSTIKIDTFKLDELFDSVGELVIAQNFIAQNEKISSIEDESISRTIETLSKITKRIQDRVMSLRMVAIKDTFEKMKRVVRDTSKKTHKEVHLLIHGEETEIDKTMIDSLSDPLIHIIRNAVDHGLEADAQERQKAGKSSDGTITLRAFHKSGNIVISVSDDGRGIDKEKVLEKAIARGVVTGDENLSDSQIFALIMQPGFSTADTISDLSGRGVGLDVVKTSIEALRGKIEIESKEGEGTTLSMILPLTLAIIDGMLVRTAEEIYIVPTLSVVESFRPEKEIVHIVKGKGEFVSLRGQYIPIIRLSKLFHLEVEYVEPWNGILVCVETENGRIAIMVDELLGRQQVVIKSLGKSLARLKEISGGAILGNGDIALILNIDELRPLLEVSHVPN